VLQEAHHRRLVRRPAGKRCEVERARWTLRRQRVWLRVQRWWPVEDRLRRQLVLQLRQLVRLVVSLTRWARSQVRLLVLRCCLEEAARRRRLVRRVLRLVRREALQWRRVWQLGQ